MDFARPHSVEAFLHLNVYRELQESGVCGATVCLTKAGRYSFTLANCYGFLDASRGLVVEPRTTLFDLGGCAKVLAALALLRVLQENGLTVAADVNSVLPPGLQVDTSRYGSVTVQHLLTHTSGLQRGPSGGGGGGGGSCDGGSALSDGAPSDAVAAAAPRTDGTEGEAASTTPLTSPRPGPDRPEARSEVRLAAEASSAADTPITSYLKEQVVYGAKPPGGYRPQDLDYMLLGAVIEHLTGEPYGTYIEDTFLTPLGVKLPPCSGSPPQQQHQQHPHPQQGGAVPGGTSGVVVAGGAPADNEDGQAGPMVYVYAAPPPPQQQQQLHAAVAGGGGEEAALGGAEAGGLGIPAGSSPRVPIRYPPPPLTPMGGLVLTPQEIVRLLPLFVQAGGGSGGGGSRAAEEDAGQAQGQAPGGGALGPSLLSTLCEIRLSDFLKDVDVAYGGLVSLGLGHCGGRVLSVESPPPAPSTREAALIAQAAAQAAAATAATIIHGTSGQGDPPPDGQVTAPPPPPSAAAVAAVSSGAGGGSATSSLGGAVPAAAADGSDGVATSGHATGGSSGGGALGGADSAAPQQQLHQQDQQQTQIPGQQLLSSSSLLVVAVDGGFAMVVACNTAGQEGAAFCRKVTTGLLEQFRPAELPRASLRSWLAPLPPPRQDAVMQLVTFPPACAVAPAAYFDGWSLLLPDYIRVHCMQAPGHGTRRSEPCELRLPKLVPPAASALLAGVAGDVPLALFGHGLGGLWAFEVARRLEGLYGRQLLHLFVCACAAPSCAGARRQGPGGEEEQAEGGDGSKGCGGGGDEGGGEEGQRSATPARFEPWRTQEAAGEAGAGNATASTSAAAEGELYELLPDEAFITACRNHPRCPRQLRTNAKAIAENVALLRADIEAEVQYNFVPPGPNLCPGVAAALASVQNRADEEARLSLGLLSCPITVLTPEEDTALGTEQTAGWEQVTTGQVRFQTVPGNYHCLEDRKHRAHVAATITAIMGRQMSVHTPWLAKMRPAGAGGRWAGGGTGGGGGGRPSGSGRPGSAASGARASNPGSVLHMLPPVYPRG